MFEHSVKVPRLYKIAAKISNEVTDGAGSVKELVYKYQKKHPNIKAMYALVTTLFQRSDEIESLLKRTQFLSQAPRLDPWLTKILMVELLWGRQCLPGKSKPEKTVLAYEQIFKAHLSDFSLDSKSIANEEQPKPRYVRVNTLLITLSEAIDGFRYEGWKLSQILDKSNYSEFLNKVGSLAVDEFVIDIHIPNLLIFPPKTHFYNHPAYKNGSIILQDKASCLPVHILGPTPGSTVLDMCAAPGMKTTQAAAALNDEGTVFAVEREPRRFETLNRIVESSGAKCVKTVNRDVLTCNAKDFPGVQYILVDPSCSGSGITGRFESNQVKDDEVRMSKLAGFQIKILRSALTRYPDAKRVVYSTCSIHPEENEDVVRQVLETNGMFKLVSVKQFVNDTWQNFGSSEFGDIGSYCLYAKPNEDFTNGFFVAVFEKLEEGEENQFFNTKIYNYKKHIDSQERRKNRRQKEQRNYLAGGNENADNAEASGNIIEEGHLEGDNSNEGKTRKKRHGKNKERAPKENEEGINLDNENQPDIEKVPRESKKIKKKNSNAITERAMMSDDKNNNTDLVDTENRFLTRGEINSSHDTEMLPNAIGEHDDYDVKVKHKKKKRKKDKKTGSDFSDATTEINISNLEEPYSKQVIEDKVHKKIAKRCKKTNSQDINDDGGNDVNNDLSSQVEGRSIKKKKRKHYISEVGLEAQTSCSNILNSNEETKHKKKRKKHTVE